MVRLNDKSTNLLEVVEAPMLRKQCLSSPIITPQNQDEKT